MPEWVASLLIQIPLVGAFMWFTFELLKRQDAASEKREQMQAAARDKRDGDWREFLGAEEQNNQAIVRIAEDVRGTTKIVSAMNSVLMAHDLLSKGAIEDVKKIRERLARAGLIDDSWPGVKK